MKIAKGIALLGLLAAVSALLNLVDLNGATVTIDAIGAQKSMAQQIIDAGGHYVLAVKACWRAFNREERLAHDGEFYQLSLLPEAWSPRAHDHPASGRGEALRHGAGDGRGRPQHNGRLDRYCLLGHR